jgi:3-phenylpropionate/trans-cinnamate dioxygenase ferredoxin reductase subunit
VRASRYVIVGASLAGLTAAETLRDEGYDGEVIVIGDEHFRPYDRPPLSKQVLRGEWGPENSFLRDEARHAKLDIEWKLGQRAVALDLDARSVIVADGEPVGFDGLVIATGATPRRIQGCADLPGVHVLRTLDDSIAIRQDLEQGPRVCVVGGGFIGSEVAATCRDLGLEVTIIETLDAPLAHLLPPELASVCAGLHLDHGVDLRCRSTVSGIEGRHRVEAVRLADGEMVPADIVVVGIGVIPETRWLASSGLAIRNGVVCDATLATSAPGVVAAGDIARWPNVVFGETMRVEHWKNAIEQGAAAARRLLLGGHGAPPFASVPFAWTDQYEAKIQILGRIQPGDEVQLVHGSYDERRFVALTGRSGRLAGAFLFNEPRHLRRWRQHIEARCSWAAALSHADSYESR